LIARLTSRTAPVAIAHRGGARLRPENTLVAFTHALALGADAIECDVHLSRDGDAVVIHDATVDRTTEASGPVSAFTAAELAGLDAGYRFTSDDGFPFRGQGHGIVTLARLLSACPGTPVIVEIKGGDVGLAHRALDVIVESGAAGRVIVGGFSAAALAAVRARRPDIPTSASQPEVQSALRRAWFRLPPRRTGYQLFQVPVRLRGRTVLSREFATYLSRAAIPVHAWIVDEEAEMEQLVGWGVTGLISDRPDRAVAVVRRWSTLNGS